MLQGSAFLQFTAGVSYPIVLVDPEGNIFLEDNTKCSRLAGTQEDIFFKQHFRLVRYKSKPRKTRVSKIDGQVVTSYNFHNYRLFCDKTMVDFRGEMFTVGKRYDIVQVNDDGATFALDNFSIPRYIGSYGSSLQVEYFHYIYRL